LAMMLIELVLAIIDFLKRATTGRELGQELLMIASRVVIAIGLRELTIISASIDATRGLPIIHVNLIGYDEHAHRRGPRSAFARWTLKGLDRCIQRLASAANLSDQRDYDIWVYSDHGQETTTAYPYISGQTILQACKKVALEPNSQQKNAETNWQRPSRAQWLSAGRWAGRLFGDGSSDTDDGKPLLQVSSCGPVGHVYSVRLLTDLQKMNAARALVNDHNVPMVLVAGKDPSVVAITDEGDYQLPECSRQLFGDDHPFVDEVGHDLVRLCHHADAGQLVLSGWRRKRSQVTFSLQAGAHGGPGAIETHGFALLPRDAPLSGGGRYLRPNDLRESALAYRRGGRPTTSRCAVGPLPQPRACDRIRVATYNVHGCLGLDGQFLPQRIARVVSQCEADVVALQELDVGRSRSGRVDQARAIAQTLNMQHHFFGAWRVEEECYGDAILSRLPFRLIRSGELPTTKANRERRGAIWIELGFDNTKLQIINTHLSLYPIERKIQAEALVGDVWAGAARQQGPTILLGDFNARPRSAAWKIIDATMRDAHLQAPGPTPATWFSTRPLFRIDHVFGTKELRVESASVLDNQLSRIASDHLPLVVQFQLNTSSNCARTSASDPLDCRLRSLPEGHQ
ncbi:MAG: endonuclease/exonuclease/phosphatase family protein, partial [Planctomycetota bacterium]